MEPKVPLPCSHQLSTCSILGHINPVHAVSVLSSIPHLDSRTGLFSWDFLPKSCVHFSYRFYFHVRDFWKEYHSLSIEWLVTFVCDVTLCSLAEIYWRLEEPPALT
jgi:hypothetical protein